MPKFKYRVIKKSGANKSGTLEASSLADAKSKLTSSGDLVTSLSQVSGSSSKLSDKKKHKKSPGGGISIGKVIKDEELTVFTRQLATLLEAGLPLLKSIEVMVRQEPNKRFKAVLEKIGETIRSEAPFLKACHNTLRF